MKTLKRAICVVAVLGGLPLVNLWGQLDPAGIVGNSPTSAAGDAAADTYATGGEWTADELAWQFGPEASTAPGGPTASATPSNTANVGTQQQVGVDVGGGTFEVNGQEAELYTVKVPYSRRLNERSTLELTLPVSMAVYDKALLSGKDAKAYGIGLNAGYAWQAFLKKDNVPYRWKLTPSTGLYYRDSSDLHEGAWVVNAGLSSSFAWQFAPGWVVNLGNSVSFAWNNGIKGYPDPVRDNQQALKNGLQVYRMLERWTLYAYVIDTEALNDAIVDSYQTYGLGAGYKLSKTRTLRATVFDETGNGGYKSVRASIGTTWQF